MGNRRKKQAPASSQKGLLNAAGALLLLMTLGVWVRTGAFTTQFWVETVWGVGSFVLSGALMWSVVFSPRPDALLRRASPRQRQTIASLATLAGLLLIAGLFWIQAARALVTSASLLAAWPLLPVVLSAAATPLMLAAVAIQATLLPAPAAWNARRLGLREMNVALLLSMPAWLLLPSGAGEWGQAQVSRPDAPDVIAGLFAVTPGPAAWFVPVLVAGVVLFIGQIALQTLRRPGAAVIVFAAVLFYQATANFLFAQAAGDVGPGATAHFLAILSAVAMDVAYMYRLPDADDRRTLWYALAIGVVITVGTALILVPRAPGHPPATLEAIAGVLAGSALVGIWCGWCGADVGRWMCSASK